MSDIVWAFVDFSLCNSSPAFSSLAFPAPPPSYRLFSVIRLLAKLPKVYFVFIF